MKNTLILLSAPVILLFASCSGSKTTDEAASMAGMMEVQVNISGDTLSMMVPDSTNGQLEIVEQNWGATEIKVGKGFQVSIESGEGDVTLKKSDIAGDDVFKLQRYLKDEPSLLFWESKNPDMPDSRFHFYTISKVGKSSYVIKDVENGEAYGEKDIQTMIDGAKSLKSKKGTEPNS